MPHNLIKLTNTSNMRVFLFSSRIRVDLPANSSVILSYNDYDAIDNSVVQRFMQGGIVRMQILSSSQAMTEINDRYGLNMNNDEIENCRSLLPLLSQETFSTFYKNQPVVSKFDFIIN
jgi:hypothetical protein